MSSSGHPILLVIQHVPWEGPHRVLDACTGIEVRTVRPFAGQPLPAPDEVAGAVAMGGPMSVHDVERHPGLEEEREWMVAALGREVPVLGICLGAQLLAGALGAEVRRAESPELGYAPVEILDRDDPVLGGLAPSTTVLHWHGEVFDLPEGATRLARSAQTEVQAFRHGSAWGVLFHPEADFALLEAWLAVPAMSREARRALGDRGAAALPAQAEAAEPELVARTTPGLRAFADLVRADRPST